MSTVAKTESIPVDDRGQFFAKLSIRPVRSSMQRGRVAILISPISLGRNNIDFCSKLSFCNVLGLSRL
jgi:hypothetical protein